MQDQKERYQPEFPFPGFVTEYLHRKECTGRAEECQQEKGALARPPRVPPGLVLVPGKRGCRDKVQPDVKERKRRDCIDFNQLPPLRSRKKRHLQNIS